MSRADPELPQDRTLAQRLGGRWIISWLLFVINSLISLVMLSAHLSYANKSTNTTVVIVYWLSALAVVGCITAVLHFTLFNNRQLIPVPLHLVALYLLACGTIFSVIYETGRNAAHLPAPGSMLLSIGITVLLYTWAGISGTMIADVLDESASRHRDLVERRVQVMLLEQSRLDLHSTIRDRVQTEVEVMMTESSSTLLTFLHSQSDRSLLPHSGKIIDAVHNSVSQSVRPLSEALWKASSQSLPRPSLKSIVVSTLHEQPIKTLWVLIIVIISTTKDSMVRFGFYRGATLLLFAIVGIVAISTSANALMRRYPKFHPHIFLATFVVFQLNQLVANMMRERWEPGSVPGSLFIAQVFASAVILFITSAIGSWRQLTKRSFAVYQKEITEDHVAEVVLGRQTAEIIRELSRVLHGAVQTRLIACGLMIEHARNNQDDVALNLALLEAIAVMQAPLPVASTGDALGVEVNRKVSLWEGLCKFDVQIDQCLNDLSNPESQEIGRVIEEGISNAVRHGGATHIALSIAQGLEGSVVVQLDDNGSGPGGGKPSVGSALLNQISGGSWTLSAMPIGTRLRVEISPHSLKL